MKYILGFIFLFLIFLPYNSLSQADTTLANFYVHLADSLRKARQYDTSNYYYQKASELYLHGTIAGLDSLPANLSRTEGRVALARSGEMESSVTNRELGEKYFHCQNRIGHNLIYMMEFKNGVQHINNTLRSAISKLSKKNSVVGDTYLVLGSAFYVLGNYDKALEYYKKSLSINTENFGMYHLKVAESYHGISAVLKEKGDYGTAMDYAKQALRIKISLLGPLHPSVAWTYELIGVIPDHKKDYFEAFKYYHLALAIYISSLGLDAGYHNTGNEHYSKKEFTEALKYYKKSLQLLEEKLGRSHFITIKCYQYIAALYGYLKDYDKAIRFYEKVYKGSVVIFGVIHPSIAGTNVHLSELYREKSEYKTAIDLAKKALEIYRFFFSSYHPKVGEVCYIMALTYEQEKDFDQALYYSQKAMQALVKGFEYNNVYVNPTLPKWYQIKAGKSTINSVPILLDVLVSKAEILEMKWKKK